MPPLNNNHVPPGSRRRWSGYNITTERSYIYAHARKEGQKLPAETTKVVANTTPPEKKPVAATTVALELQWNALNSRLPIELKPVLEQLLDKSSVSELNRDFGELRWFSDTLRTNHDIETVNIESIFSSDYTRITNRHKQMPTNPPRTITQSPQLRNHRRKNTLAKIPQSLAMEITQTKRASRSSWTTRWSRIHLCSYQTVISTQMLLKRYLRRDSSTLLGWFPGSQILGAVAGVRVGVTGAVTRCQSRGERRRRRRRRGRWKPLKPLCYPYNRYKISTLVSLTAHFMNNSEKPGPLIRTVNSGS